MKDLKRYKTVNKIKQFNFQINRVLTYGSDACDERLVTARLAKVSTLDEWYKAWTELSDIAINNNRYMHAAYYDRMAEFFLKQDDPRKSPLYDKCIKEFKTAFEQYRINYKTFEVPYKNGFMMCIRMTPSQYKQTVLVCGGYDSFIEEFVLQVHKFVQQGYEVILMEGPGQGDCVRQHLYFEASFEEPVAAVLDFFEVKACAMVGISWGGYFALRTAAFEKRVTKIVAYDAMDDGYEVMTNIFPRPIRWYVRKLIKEGDRTKVNLLLKRIAKRSVLADWMLAQGQFITGTESIYDMYMALQEHNLNGLYEKIDQDVLLMAGEKDHYIPLCQFERCRKRIINAKTMKARCFSAIEGGEQHCQIGNHELAIDTILRWLA
ncbi:Pimeloyl-ACP methyl ester carboxylesterase [Pseudobutyrivibrio sp. YE44]|uniref:alpha/beta fold hydrolase n=1 Tax=Pseudobutyrivibrio sp. YE44 TaxID=1520802 RepID=UPI0008925603|nr:alpha/beta hydrolase [Pseudobutyrivibrio sp. YE44]SDB50481.1 Pimeloyl-ACP methyl ester carboxylesterase [Pseudobutyrivibrio sp. YE44]